MFPLLRKLVGVVLQEQYYHWKLRLVKLKGTLFFLKSFTGLSCHISQSEQEDGTDNKVGGFSSRVG